jgi:hypothetical protein
MVPMITLFIFSALDRKSLYRHTRVCVCLEKAHIKLALTSSRLLIRESLLLLSKARWSWVDNGPWRPGKENCHCLTIFEWENQTIFQKEQNLHQHCYPQTNVYSHWGNFFILFSQLRIITKIYYLVASLRFCFMECYSCRKKKPLSVSQTLSHF